MHLFYVCFTLALTTLLSTLVVTLLSSLVSTRGQRKPRCPSPRGLPLLGHTPYLVSPKLHLLQKKVGCFLVCRWLLEQ